MSETWAGGNGRVREVQVVDPERRHLYLAAQIDEVERNSTQELAAIRAILVKIFVAIVSLLISFLASAVTYIVTRGGR